MPEATTQEIAATQGTRLSDTPPWMSYSKELEGKSDPTLDAAVEEYATHRHVKSSSQNEEELCRQRELNGEVAKQYQFLHPREYADQGPRVGRVMHADEFIGILRDACKLKVWYRDHPHADKRTLVYTDANAMQVPTVACWVQNGYMPEYEFVRFDDHGIPLDSQKRGWRTCLLQMILKGIISEDMTHKAFGLATGPASIRYNETLYGWRNTRTE